MKKHLFILFLCVSYSLVGQSDWSVKMADAFMKRNSDSIKVAENKPAQWDYEQGLMLRALEKVWYKTANPKYFDYIKQEIDLYVKSNGNITSYKYDDFNLDNIATGRALLMLYQQSLENKEKYKVAANLLWKQLQNQPKNQSGGYWHKKRYPNQMWLDGLFMAEPFAAEYSKIFNSPEHFDEVIHQFDLIEKYAVDKSTGLIYHAYDESREQKWANPQTGLSPHFWGRAIGWYAMALVDVLDYFPQEHAGRARLIQYLNRLAPVLANYQDEKSGVWYQILDLPQRDGNYLEASASCMFVYAMAKGARLGYLPTSYLKVAQRGYEGVLKEFIQFEEDGSPSIYKTVSVGGLGGNPYRDGSFEYYMSEPLRKNDLKGVGAFIFASLEIEKLKEALPSKNVAVDYYFNREFRKDLNGNREQFHYTWEDKMHSGFWWWGQIFNDLGSKTLAIKDKPSPQNLKNVDVYIIVDPDTPKETESPNYIESSDIQVIKNWVKNGGTLVLMANDTTNCEVIKFNELAKAFGVSFTMKNINFVPGGRDYDLAKVDIPENNEVFKTARKVYIKELVTLDVKAPAKAIVKKGEDIIIATSPYGKGKVLVVGDPWLYNEYVDGRILGVDFHNYEAAKDIAKWAIK